MVFSDRIKSLPPYLFAEIDRRISEKRRAGTDIIDFGIGDPDIPTPKHIIDACCKAAKNPENHRYPSYWGMLSFRKAVAERYERDFGIDLDPESEVITLLGSKEGIHNIHLGLANPGDVVLYTEPGYPVYRTGPLFAGAVPHKMPLLKENGFLPDLDAVPKDVREKAKVMWINYPNNPTAAVADRGFYERVVNFAKENDIIVCSDEAYSAITYDSRSPCFLEVDGAKEVGVVFDSLSKTYNMTGWRIAYAVGNSEVISALGKVKTNIDSGAPQIIQQAGIAALTSSQDCVSENIRIYKERRDTFADGLNKIGLPCDKPKATFYIWLEVPAGDSMAFAGKLLEECAVVCTPGVGFGPSGEGFARFALTSPVSRIEEAIERIKKAF